MLQNLTIFVTIRILLVCVARRREIADGTSHHISIAIAIHRNGVSRVLVADARILSITVAAQIRGIYIVRAIWRELRDERLHGAIEGTLFVIVRGKVMLR